MHTKPTLLPPLPLHPQAALAAQAARMASLASRLPRSADVIPLNVGGQLLATSRRTLTLVPDSLLGTMFSGHWDEHLTRWDGGGLLGISWSE